MRRLVAALVPALTLLTVAGCGGGDNDVVADEEPAATSSTETSSSAPRTSTPRTKSTTPSPVVMTPEQEAGFVAGVTAQTVAESGDALSAQLVKSNSLVEAQTDFRFDQPARTLVLAVTSTFSTDTYVPELAYDLATEFASVFWGSQVPASIRPESLPLFSVTVDSATFTCPAPTMVALADRELSEEMFVQQCGA